MPRNDPCEPRRTRARRRGRIRAIPVRAAIAAVLGMVVCAARIVALAAMHGLLYGVRRAMMAPDTDHAGIGWLQGASLAALLERLGPT